jgi:hypothetical protein
MPRHPEDRMPVTPVVVTQHHLNLTGQNVLTFVSWALTIILLAVTVEMGRRERSPFYVLIVLAAMAGAFAEALYDVAFSLYFYSTHGMQTFYTVFGIPQPVWTHSGYAVLYALPGEALDACIAIRTIVLDEGVALLQAGAGSESATIPTRRPSTTSACGSWLRSRRRSTSRRRAHDPPDRQLRLVHLQPRAAVRRDQSESADARFSQRPDHDRANRRTEADAHHRFARTLHAA